MTEEIRPARNHASDPEPEGEAPEPRPLGDATHEELRHRARRILDHREGEHSIEEAMLADDAWKRLARQPRDAWKSRSHFMATAAQAMRQILADEARKRRAAKRGGGDRPITILSEHLGREDREVDVVALNEAITLLKEHDPREGEIVELRFFSGLAMQEIADHLSLSLATIEDEWRHARAWLRRRLHAPRSRGGH